MPALESPRPDRVLHGQVFTRSWVVNVILDLVGYTPDRQLSSMRLVEPSCGTGSFVSAAVARLVDSWHGSPPPADQVTTAIRAFDLLSNNVNETRRAVQHLLTKAGMTIDDAQALAKSWINQDDYLLGDDFTLFSGDGQSIDFIVGNPPYIRLEEIPEETAAAYRARWPTMLGRADIYVGFFERALRSLAPDGKLGFICADRWMRNQYGAGLRKLVSNSFSVDIVWSMHDVNAFERAVAAYPAITVLSARQQGRATVAETTSVFSEVSARTLIEWNTSQTTESTSGPGYVAHKLPHWFPGDELWPSGDPARIALIEYLNDNFESLENPRLGTKVGIGVATGADGIFITRDPTVVESDRLLPLSMVSDTRSGQFQWSGNYLINPWQENGTLVTLTDFPRLNQYFIKHRARLSDRHTARAAPTRWYKTIDKVNHNLIHREKLLIQDMRTSINPVLESGGHYPHHNLYYVISDHWDMQVLGGLLLSRVAQAFIEAYSVRMRGNTLRFQSQYLRKIRVPDPHSMTPALQMRLRNAFASRDVDAATEAARRAYKIAPDVHL